MSEITVVKTAEDPASRALQVTVPVDRVAAAESRAVKSYASRARLPGFRKGKAPEAVVRKRFAEEIRQAVIQDVIRAGWDAAREAEDLKPISDPAVRNFKFEAGQPVEFELFVEVKPDITLERLRGFTITRSVAPVSDEQVAEQLEHLRERRASWLPVESGKPAPGNMVRGSVAPIEDGTVHEAKPFTVVLGEGQAIPDLEEHIMGMAAGTTTEADVRFPEDHPDADRRGKTRRVRIELQEIKRQELPPLDDALARELGEFDTLDALRGAIRDDLEAEAVRTADSRVREDLVTQVAEANNVFPPPSLVERVLHGFAHAYEIAQEQYEHFSAQFRPIAMQQVRRDLVLGAVAEQAGLRATEEELDARVARIAESRGKSPGEVWKSLQEAGRLAELERSITEEKVFEHLLAQSTITEETP